MISGFEPCASERKRRKEGGRKRGVEREREQEREREREREREDGYHICPLALDVLVEAETLARRGEPAFWDEGVGG